MSGIAVLLALVAVGQGNAAQPTASMSSADVLQLLEGAHAGLVDFYCEYEGMETLLQKAAVDLLPPGSEGVSERYSGQFLYKKFDDRMVTIFHRNVGWKDKPRSGIREEIILSDGKKCELYGRSENSSTGGSSIRHTVLSDLSATGSYGTIYLFGTFRDYLRYSDKALVVEGREQVDGAECERYAIVMGKAPPYDVKSPDVMIERFWVDFARGGHVLKWEWINRGHLWTRTSQIVLERVGKGEGGDIWMPVSGTFEAFDNATGMVAMRQTYHVLMESVRVNKGVERSRFAIKYRQGDRITDSVKKTVRQFGQDIRPPSETIAQAQERLEETLRKAEADRSELRARSWSRGGEIDWSLWSPLAGFVIATPPLAMLWIKRRRERS